MNWKKRITNEIVDITLLLIIIGLYLFNVATSFMMNQTIDFAILIAPMVIIWCYSCSAMTRQDIK